MSAKDQASSPGTTENDSRLQPTRFGNISLEIGTPDQNKTANPKARRVSNPS